MDVRTLTVDNFRGSMTSYQNGAINSGQSFVVNTYGNDPFTRPGQLTWSTRAEQIDPSGSVITDLVMAGKERVESGILYVYAIGHTGRLYKIQVNDPTTYDPSFDNPLLLTTLAVNTPTFKRGGFIDFFGTTEKIYIGHDKGVTSVNFDGSGEAFVGVLGSYTQDVPRPLRQFVGSLYFGNGANIGEITVAATVSTYTKLSPGFPVSTQVRDMDASSNGIYLDIVVTRVALPDITSAAQDVTSTASTDSYIFKWNGTDAGYTSFDTFSSFSLTANTTFGPYQYTFGYDSNGAAVFNPSQKIVTMPEQQSPMPNAVASNGNIVSWISPLYYGGFLELGYTCWGSLDFEVGTGYWSQFGGVATGTETDVICVPFQLNISNFGLGSSGNGYPNNQYGTSKIYYSTLETSAAPTTKYKFYQWSPAAVRSLPGAPIVGALYQTQTQLFSKKIKLSNIRIYGEPWDTGVSFSIDLIGSTGTPMANGSYTFTEGSTLTAGNDMCEYNPACAPTYALGLQITNLGNVNCVINKVEIDYSDGGQ